MALVAKLPFLVFFNDAILSSLYIISPSCFVDPILNSFFEILKILPSKVFIFLRNFTDNFCKKSLSIFTPFISIKANIFIKGFSKIS